MTIPNISEYIITRNLTTAQVSPKLEWADACHFNIVNGEIWGTIYCTTVLCYCSILLSFTGWWF